MLEAEGFYKGFKYQVVFIPFVKWFLYICVPQPSGGDKWISFSVAPEKEKEFETAEELCEFCVEECKRKIETTLIHKETYCSKQTFAVAENEEEQYSILKTVKFVDNDWETECWISLQDMQRTVKSIKEKEEKEDLKKEINFLEKILDELDPKW